MPAACRYLEDENTRSPLKGLTPAARQERLNQAALTAAMPHAPALRKQYGERVLTDPQQRAALSKKIQVFMQRECQFSVLVAGEDDFEHAPPLPDASPAPAAPKARPLKQQAPPRKP